MSTQVYIHIRERRRGYRHAILCEFVILKLFFVYVFEIREFRIAIGRAW